MRSRPLYLSYFSEKSYCASYEKKIKKFVGYDVLLFKIRLQFF